MSDTPDSRNHKHSPEITNTSAAQGIAYIGLALFLTGPTAFLAQHFGTIGSGFDPMYVTQVMYLGIVLVMAAGVMALITGPTMFKLLDAADDQLTKAFRRLKNA